MGRIADPLREFGRKWGGILGDAGTRELDEAIEGVEREHGNRMQQCRRETMRHCLHRIRSMMNDMERGIKWARRRKPPVRCRDCEYGCVIEGEDGKLVVDCIGPLTEPWDYLSDSPNVNIVDPDGFCAWGKPRERKWKVVE